MNRPRLCMSGLLLSIILGWACVRNQKEPEPEKTWDLDARSLHNSYLDGSNRWTGKTIRVMLIPDAYTVSSEGIYWHTGRDTDPPSIVFIVVGAPKDNKEHIELVGVCRGRVEDGKLRGAGHRFHIRVDVISLSKH